MPRDCAGAWLVCMDIPARPSYGASRHSAEPGELKITSKLAIAGAYPGRGRAQPRDKVSET